MKTSNYQTRLSISPQSHTILFLLKYFIVVHSYLNSSSLIFRFPYSVLLAAPSFSIPSQPAALPAISSTLPNPSRLASRFALAAFIASMPACLSVAAEAFQASEPVAAPTADCYCNELVMGLQGGEGQKGGRKRCTSAAPLTYWAWPPMREGCCC
jgi:hypothetical protein